MIRIVPVRAVPRLARLVYAALVVVLLAAFDPLVRLIATAGDLDPSFGIGGMATLPSGLSARASAVAVQDDGKIVAAGDENGLIRVARFNPDGSLDTGFGAGGATSINLGLNEFVLKVLLRPSGQIIVVARADASLRAPIAAVLQYNPDGSPDTTFGAGGLAVQNLTQPLHQVTDAALQPDGGVLVVGHGFFEPAPGAYIDFIVSRFTTAGTVDTAFGGSSLLHTDIYGGDEAFAIVMQPDGKFIVAGFSDTAPGARRHFAFVRYLPDGTLDASFGTAGRVTVDPALGLTAVQSWLIDVIVQPDGGIVGAGFVEYPSGLADGAVVRLLPDGQLDLTFSGDGRAIFDDGSLGNGFGASFRGGIGRLALQASGRLLAAAGNDAVLGILPDGTLDATFHADGIARLPGAPNDMTLQDDGKIVVGSSAIIVDNKPGFRVLRLIAENTPPLLTPAAGISAQRGTSARMTIGTASDASDALTTLVIAPVAGTVPAGVTIGNVLVNATSGAVSAVVTASCTAATGSYAVQFSITDGGGATTIATLPVDVLLNTGPTLSIRDRTKLEQSFFSEPAVLVVTATGGVCAPITVHYETANDTAIAPADYAAASGTATIAVGQASATISVLVIGDQLPEADETFFVNLDSPLNATIADGQGEVRIQDDDPPFIQFAPPATLDLVEKDDPLATDIVTLKLTRLTGLTGSSSVRVNLFGSATSGSDYVLLSPQFVNFAAGETEAEVRLAIIGDLIEEQTESVTVSISNPVNATIGTPSSVSLTIRDDDAAPADAAAPIVTGTLLAAPNGAGWHKADVAVALIASDGAGSGVKSISYTLSGAQAQALTVVPAASTSIPIVTEGVTVVSFFAEDVAGNVAASQSLTVRLDKTAPGSVITSPQARVYTLNEAVAAAYGCSDGGSGIATCTGTTLAGAPVDTASAGAKSYSATATDAAGNQSTVTIAYTVVVPPPTFGIVALYDALQEHTRGSAIPIKLQVVNAAGTNVSSSTLIVEALAVSSGTEIGAAEEEVLDAGQANPLGRFRFVSDGAYLFNLKTTNLTAGPHVLVLRVAGDSTLYAVPFRIRLP